MGLPRYLNTKLLAIVCTDVAPTHKLMNEMFRLGIQASTATITPKTNITNAAQFAIKKEWGWMERPKERKAVETRWVKKTSYPEYVKVPIEWFTEWRKVDGVWTWFYIEAKVNRYFRERALEISMARKEAEYKIIMAKEELDRMRNTEQGRTFKGRLRQIIMERDGYKCVLCGKGADDGVKLEVDHIKAWEDGGRTIYDNGRTVCSDCNKGLHWAKKFNEKLKEVSEATA